MGGEIGGMGSWRLISQIGERWEVGPKKQVGDGRLAPKTGGRRDVETPATPPPIWKIKSDFNYGIRNITAHCCCSRCIAAS